MDLGKRATRGRRTAELQGEELEEDELFWGDNVWKDDESDDSFEVEEEEDKPDEFDSDFNDTEDEGDSDSDDEDDKKEKVQVESQQVDRLSYRLQLINCYSYAFRSEAINI